MAGNGRSGGGLRNILFGNEKYVEELAKEFKAEIARLRKRRGAMERQIQKEPNRVNAGIKRCLKYIVEGDGPPGLVRDELTELEARKGYLEKAIALGHEEVPVDMHPNMAELYRKKVLELQDLLTEESTRPRAAEILRSLIDRIEVHPGDHTSEAQVVLVGALAQILAFSQEKTTAAPDKGGGGRFEVVAGARYRRYLPLSRAWITETPGLP